MSKQTRVFFAGDFCSKPSTSLITVDENLKNIINSCDIKVINFEVPLKPKGKDKGEYFFYQNDDAPSFLEEIGFNLFSFANNHVFDYGENGFYKTINAFIEKPFGSGTYKEAYEVKVIKHNNIKIGFMALTYAARFGVFTDVNNKGGLGSAWINDPCVNHKIMEAKKNLDYLIMLPHDGIEYIDVPIPEVITRYRDFIDYGADAVIGTHPHCPQGWEEYNGKPIFYSLGNFFFNSKDSPDYRAWNRPHWYDGLCVIIEFDEKQGITHHVINTKNTNNLAIELNTSEDIKLHNKKLCNYLLDKVAYNKYLNEQLLFLAEKQELPIIINSAFENQHLLLSIVALVKTIIKKTLGRKEKKNQALANLLRNDTRRNALLRIINSNNFD